jgi:hypothetical protein
VRRARALAPVDLAPELDGVVLVEASREPAEIAAAIRELDPDVVVDLALASTGLALARDAPVWSFRFGADQDAVPGLGELVRNEPVTPIRLVEDGPHGSRTVLEGTVPTQASSYVRQLDAVLLAGAPWVGNALARGALGRAGDGSLPPSSRPQDRRTVPAGQAVRLGVAVARGWLGTRYRALRRRAHWNIGIVHRPVSTMLVDGPLTDVHWLRPPEEDGYVADPFGVRVDGELWVLAEHLGFTDQHGRIVAMRGEGPDALGEPVRVMDDAVHLSYPFLVEEGGEIWCIPERGGAREVALYRAVEFPLRWERTATLLEGLRASDPSFVRHEGRWWMFCTDDDAAPAIDLHAFHAERLEGPWVPHPWNPLKVDVASSRPGGTPFVHEGVLHRPAQDCTGTYGAALTVNRVDVLTPERFEERRVARIEPDPAGPYPAGLHTLAVLGDVTIVDGKRWVGNRAHVTGQVRRVLRKLRRR